MLRDRFALMAPPLAHAMVKMGEWLDVTPGTTLTREGQAAGALTYLASGQAAELSGCQRGEMCEQRLFRSRHAPSGPLKHDQHKKHDVDRRQQRGRRNG